MNAFKLLIADDDEQDMIVFRDSVAKYQDEKQRSIELIECKTVEAAIKELDDSFDGAIIDLKFEANIDEGNKIIKNIVDSYLRIPIAIITGTPENADLEFSYIGVFRKGEIKHTDILDRFFGIHNTGLTRIMGGRGIIEQKLNDVFCKNILPQHDIWVRYGKENSLKTEKALLRFTLNHLIQLLDDDGEQCFPEEVYLCPPLYNGIKTGSIVKKINNDSFYVVMNPACDLVVRSNGAFKTDRILFVEIEPEQELISSVLSEIGRGDRKKSRLEAILKNNHTDYFHWLPETNYFKGGFINFRRIFTLTKDEFKTEFENPKIQISPFFVKDVVSRFSSYYARQGQPDIEITRTLHKHIPPVLTKK